MELNFDRIIRLKKIRIKKSELSEEEKYLKQIREICQLHDFELIPLTELQDNGVPDTQSDIFNEFWLRYW